MGFPHCTDLLLTSVHSVNHSSLLTLTYTDARTLASGYWAGRLVGRSDPRPDQALSAESPGLYVRAARPAPQSVPTLCDSHTLRVCSVLLACSACSDGQSGPDRVRLGDGAGWGDGGPVESENFGMKSFVGLPHFLRWTPVTTVLLCPMAIACPGCGAVDVVFSEDGDWVVLSGEYYPEDGRQVSFCPDCGLKLEGLTLTQKADVVGVVAFGRMCQQLIADMRDERLRRELETVARQAYIRGMGIRRDPDGWHCSLCLNRWLLNTAEHHDPGCPAEYRDSP